MIFRGIMKDVRSGAIIAERESDDLTWIVKCSESSWIGLTSTQQAKKTVYVINEENRILWRDGKWFFEAKTKGEKS